MFQLSSPVYTPTYVIRKSSPLAPLNPNACPRFPFQMVSSEKKVYDKSLHPQKRVPQKPFLQRRPEEEKDRRRGVYLNKVRQTSDDKRWQSRSEQILQKDFLSRHKRWEQEQAHSAPDEASMLEDENLETEQDVNPAEEVEMIDQILSQEDQEFEALISLLQNEHCDQNHTASAYGSDDEEYEQLFKDVMSKEEVCEGDAKEAAKTNTDEIMDTSMD